MMILMAIAAGCAPAQPEGTAVGNPGQTKMLLASPHAAGNGESTYLSARTEAVSWLLSENGVGYSEYPVDQEIDLLDAFHIDTPDGEFSHAELWLSYVEVELESSDGLQTLLWMEDVFIELEKDGGFLLEDELYNFEMASPGWMDVALPSVFPEDELFIDPEHALYDELETSLFRDSALFIDLDGDGSLDELERSKALVAEGSGRSDDPETDVGASPEEPEDEPELTNIPAEVGCQSHAAPHSLQLLLMLLGVAGYRSNFFSRR